MFLFRKNIILVPSDFDGVSNVKGLVSLDCYDSKIICNLKTYNLSIQKPLLLGVSINNKINKITVDSNQVKNMQFEIKSTIKNTDDISCVLLNMFGSEYKIMLWGSNQINNGYKASLQAILDDVQNEKLNKQDILPMCEHVDEKNNLHNDLFNNEVNKEINNNTNDCKSDSDFDYSELEQDEFFNNKIEQEYNENNKYCEKLYNVENNLNNNIVKNIEKEDDFVTSDSNDKTEIYSYNDEKINDFIDMSDDKVDTIKKNVDDLSFYERIYPQIEKIFNNNKQEVVLNEILPSSKFCRVEFEDGSGYYVFGIIYDDGLPKYLCYGLPAKKDSQPPEELSNLYQWLPIDATDENGDGYYMMYQDALTGKNIALEII